MCLHCARATTVITFNFIVCYAEHLRIVTSSNDKDAREVAACHTTPLTNGASIVTNIQRHLKLITAWCHLLVKYDLKRHLIPNSVIFLNRQTPHHRQNWWNSINAHVRRDTQAFDIEEL